MAHDRRTFLQGLLGAGAFAATFPSIQRALAIPAHHRTGTIRDVEHVVILMQENRSFDHYFGTMRGVRGFGDPRAVRLPSGASVFEQPGAAGAVLPYHPDAAQLGLAFLVDLPHGWNDTHAALRGGKYDGWVPAKSPQTMAYLTRQDIPYHHALADAFTVCDAYHCSFLGATDPNRYHMWTGWVGNDGTGGGPVLDNSEAGYDWSTYPERLQRAGISWKVYQDAGAGLDAAHYWGWGDDAFIGNYGDNSLLYFHQYQNAAPGSPLHQGARQATNIAQGGTLFDQLHADVAARRLPQVSWVVAPEAYSEHGNWPANWGAYYVDQVLAALTADPALWSRTAFFVMFDENDGFFDHMVPPVPPMSRAQGVSTIDASHELMTGRPGFVDGPVGLGVRVPMTVISPWSKGGWVSSEVFDHTSLIRFLEARFADENPDLVESNITPWRRAVCGDLTSCFDFRSPDARVVSLPSTTAYAPADLTRQPDYVPAPPAQQQVPRQEPGLRPARPVPYELHVRAEADVAQGALALHFRNSGRAAAVLQVRLGQGAEGPWTYTVGAGDAVDESLALAALGLDVYDVSVHGPNGFYRQYAGRLSTGHGRADLAVRASYDTHGDTGVTLEITNRGGETARLRIVDGYAHDTLHRHLGAGQKLIWHFGTGCSHGWYELTIEVESDPRFRQVLAGHVETGRDSASDPKLGG